LAFQKVNFSFFGHRNLFLGLISVAQDGKFRIRMEEAGGGDIMRNKLPGNVFREGHLGNSGLKSFFNNSEYHSW
jgi:hypothetical protein